MPLLWSQRKLVLMAVSLWSSQCIWTLNGQQTLVPGGQADGQVQMDQGRDVTLMETPYLDLSTVALSLQENASVTDDGNRNTTTEIDNNATAVPGSGITVINLIPTERSILGENLHTDKVFLWTKNPELYVSDDTGLLGHVYLTIKGKRSAAQCALECIKQSRCSSFNFYSTSHLCELSNSSHVESPENLAHVSGCQYHVKGAFSIDKRALGPCAEDPCSGHGRCLETRSISGERSHLCLCHHGWTGPGCQVADLGPRWGDWEPWSACSVTCNRGWRMRSRTCEDSTNGMSLSPGHCYGASQEYGTCELQQCPQPPPTDDLLDAVSEEVSSLVSAPRKNSILHIFVCLVMVALEVILEFWKKEEMARSKI
ncbi:thrombospondin type-1 domain-containing protein 1 [Elysia marginata]|uniref:Thrombospondin type-1 domain-containing protein 1 n=1 Tax=Elysia marginata TaxID=1093978 RepID=A0AAV4I7M0_9GAST|nr:thrombospondin type-1 domain-containing protein 1 [Elysia marginata]